jgi:hypothetical protein
MKKRNYKRHLIAVLFAISSISLHANTCANAYQMNLVSCGPGYSALTSTFGEPGLTTNPCALASGTEGVNWYTFVGTGDQVNASTVGAMTFFDTKIWVFEGSCGSLNCIGANNDYGGGTSSQISFPTTLGLIYYIVVGGNGNAEGEYLLKVDSGLPSNGPTLSVVACDSYLTEGGNTYTTSGVYTDTIPNAAGCDSTTTIALTIQTIDNTVWYTGTVFSSNASGVSYQWIDCATGDPLPGETSSILLPPGGGSYAVIVSNGTCTDTSDCISDLAGLEESIGEIDVMISPNPSNGLFKMQFPTGTLGELIITDVLGKAVDQIEIISETMEIDLQNQANGFFLIFIRSNNGSSTYRIMKR